MNKQSDTVIARAVYLRIVTLLLLIGEAKTPEDEARIMHEVRGLAAYLDTIIAGR